MSAYTVKATERQAADRADDADLADEADLAGEEADAGVAVAGLCEERGRRPAHAGQAPKLPADPPAAQVVVALRVLDPADDKAGQPERPEVGGERGHVLVDPEALLVLLVLDLAARTHRARPLVERGDRAAATGDTRHLGNHPPQVERVVERSDAVDEVEGARREGKVLTVCLDPCERPHSLLVERAAAEADERVGEDVGRDVLDSERNEVLGSPRLRSTNLEHAHPGTHEPLEQQRERVLVRLPRPVLPGEVAGQVRQVSVDLVVGLVPALGAGHRRPTLDLGALFGDSRDAVVEHPRNAVFDRKNCAATGAAEPVRGLLEPRPADGAPHDVEGDGHPLSIPTSMPNTAPLPFRP